MCCKRRWFWLGQGQSKKEGKDQELIQSSTKPDPGYQWESDNVTNTHHKQEPRGQPFPSRWPQGINKQTCMKAKQNKKEIIKMIHKRSLTSIDHNRQNVGPVMLGGKELKMLNFWNAIFQLMICTICCRKQRSSHWSDLILSNRTCLSQFREIPWNQTTDVHRGSTLIKRVTLYNVTLMPQKPC